MTKQTDLESIVLSEISQRERQISHDLTYMWNLKTKPKQNKTKRHSGGLPERGGGQNRSKRLRGTNFQLCKK